MTREEAIKQLQGVACSKTEPSHLALGLTEAVALKLVRHYVKSMPKGSILGPMVEERVRMVTLNKRTH